MSKIIWSLKEGGRREARCFILLLFPETNYIYVSMQGNPIV